MFGREPKLNVDVNFGLITSYDEVSTFKYYEKMKMRLQKAFMQAQTAVKMSQNTDSKYSFADYPVYKKVIPQLISLFNVVDDHDLVVDDSDTDLEEDVLYQDVPEDHPKTVDDENSTADVESSIADDE